MNDDRALEQAAAWLAEGRGVALATVVKTWGSAPRPTGSQLAINDEGAFVGSVSGGCIEGAVAAELGAMACQRGPLSRDIGGHIQVQVDLLVGPAHCLALGAVEAAGILAPRGHLVAPGAYDRARDDRVEQALRLPGVALGRVA